MYSFEVRGVEDCEGRREPGRLLELTDRGPLLSRRSRLLAPDERCPFVGSRSGLVSDIPARSVGVLELLGSSPSSVACACAKGVGEGHRGGVSYRAIVDEDKFISGQYRSSS